MSLLLGLANDEPEKFEGFIEQIVGILGKVEQTVKYISHALTSVI